MDTKIFFLLILFFLEFTDAINFVSLLNANYGLKLDEQLQRRVNKLFYTLKIKKDFAESENIRWLLGMYHSLRSIQNYNWKMYDEIKHLVHFAESRIDEFYELIKEVFNMNNLIEPQSTTNTTENTTILNDSSLSKISIRHEILNINNTFDHNSKGIVNEIKINDLIADTTNNNTKIDVTEEDDIAKNNRRFKDYDSKVLNPDFIDEFDNYNVSTSMNNRRIYEGKKAKIKKYAFAASVHINGQFACTSSIISQNLVVTAASCLQLVYFDKSNINSAKIQIRIGTEFSHQHGELLSANKVYFHPSYDPVTLKNNLAIIKMKRNLRFSLNIKRIRLSRNVELPSNIKKVVALGWGEVNKYAEGNQQLTAAHLNLYNLQDCIDSFSEQYVTQKNFCAGARDKGSGACMGDIGGAAIVADVLVGVISFGPPNCGAPQVPTVFTKIGYYWHWIEKIIEKESSMRVVEKPEFKNPDQHNIREEIQENVHSDVKPRQHTECKNYDKEVQMLQEILTHFAVANHSIMNEMNGDLGKVFKDIIETNTLRNLFAVPSKEIIHEAETTRPIKSGLPKPMNVLRNIQYISTQGVLSEETEKENSEPLIQNAYDSQIEKTEFVKRLTDDD